MHAVDLCVGKHGREERKLRELRENEKSDLTENSILITQSRNDKLKIYV